MRIQRWDTGRLKNKKITNIYQEKCKKTKQNKIEWKVHRPIQMSPTKLRRKKYTKNIAKNSSAESVDGNRELTGRQRGQRPMSIKCSSLCKRIWWLMIWNPELRSKWTSTKEVSCLIQLESHYCNLNHSSLSTMMHSKTWLGNCGKQLKNLRNRSLL